MSNKIDYVVEEEGCARLDKYLRKVFPGITQSMIEKLLRKGLISLNNVRVPASTRVKTGDVINVSNVNLTASCSREETGKISASLLELIKSNIIYEDEYVIAVNKPAGVNVQGGTKVRASISDLLRNIIEGEQLYIVHRLDKDTSGVLLLARKVLVARNLSEELRCRRVKKQYLAVTEGVPPQSNGTIDLPVFCKKRLSKEGNIIVSRDAKTAFSVVKASENYSIMLLKPVTGRKHQLRIHMSQNKCPIIGDSRYNVGGLSRDKLHLHALRITFELFSKSITVSAPVPAYIDETIHTLFGCSLDNIMSCT